MSHKPMPTYREGQFVIPLWAMTVAQKECANYDISPQVGDTLTTIQWDPEEVQFSFVETRADIARHFLAVPLSLLRWAFKIGWFDFKRFIRGQPKRPIQSVAEHLQEVYSNE